MKIQCDVCERAEGRVLCCADEAVLCSNCDERVHAANKLAGKHQRLPLNSSSQSPKCDICQEKSGYFFCLEDRALLCRQCDVSIHTASPYVSSHQRFLVTGVRVAPQRHSSGSTAADPSNSTTSIASSGEPPDKKPLSLSSSAGATPAGYSVDQMAGFRPHWPLDEILISAEYNNSYEFSERGSS